MPQAALLSLALVAIASSAVAAMVAVRARRAANARRNETVALRARVAEIAAMAGGLAHEIKNPLSTIGMNAQLLAEAIDDLPLDEQDRVRITRRIGTLTRETERLRGILEDFLDYAGELRLHARPADLGPIVEELADFFLPEAEKRGVRLRVERTPFPLIAVVDTPHLKQALLNLMINAAQAMDDQPDGVPRELIARVGIAPGPARQPQIQIIDTGPGIPDDKVARIFEPYFTTKAGGTGLGLPTTRRIIEAHDGTLTVDTHPGRGTAFTITLPRPEPEREDPESDQGADPEPIRTAGA
jgi:signal transduction histidine kinase